MPDLVKILIVGAGPAGTAAAIQLAKSGLDVVILESKRFPRPRPGETLHPGIEPLLRKLGVDEQVNERPFLRFPGINVQNRLEPPSFQPFQPFGSTDDSPWMGYQIPRSDFDQILLDRAVDLGAKLKTLRALKPLLDQDRVVGVLTDDGEFFADVVIDAAGGNHWLARYIEVGFDVESSPRVVKYGYFKNHNPLQYQTPLFRYESDGWSWFARVCESEIAWVRLFEDADAVSNDFAPDKENAIGPTRGSDVTWRIAKQCAGPGWFAAGDAAFVLDPASSHGVLKAIMSGMMVAHLVAHRNQISEVQAIEHHQSWLREQFYRDVERLQESTSY